jgi:hypothetical protein
MLNNELAQATGLSRSGGGRPVFPYIDKLPPCRGSYEKTDLYSYIGLTLVFHGKQGGQRQVNAILQYLTPLLVTVVGMFSDLPRGDQ